MPLLSKNLNNISPPFICPPRGLWVSTHGAKPRLPWICLPETLRQKPLKVRPKIERTPEKQQQTYNTTMKPMYSHEKKPKKPYKTLPPQTKQATKRRLVLLLPCPSMQLSQQLVDIQGQIVDVETQRAPRPSEVLGMGLHLGRWGGEGLTAGRLKKTPKKKRLKFFSQLLSFFISTCFDTFHSFS